MIKIEAELQRSYGRLLKREPVFISDDNFALGLITDFHLADIIVVYDNGGQTVTKHHSNINEIPIPKEILKAGVLKIKVTLLTLGVAVKSWEIEPIVLKEIDKGFEAYAEVEALKEHTREHASLIAELSEKLRYLEAETADLKQQISQLWELHEV